jgi:MFS family permease
LSELQGRNPVYYITFFITASTAVMALLTVVLFIPQAMSRNITTMLIARFLSGLSASVGATMVGGTVADIFDTKDRGTPMNLFGMGSLTGTGLGPFVAGFIYSNENLGWR